MKLEPCPNVKCRSRSAVFHGSTTRSQVVRVYGECMRCGVRGPFGDNVEEATQFWNALPRPASGGLEGAVEVENNSWSLILRGLAARPYAIDGDNILTARDCRTLRKAADEIDRLRALPDSGEVELRDELKPFVDFAENVDENGWASDIHKEPISTWFGPSDFRRLAALATTPEDK